MSQISWREAILGRTGIRVRRMGFASGYNPPKDALLWAFEQGVNYFWWGAVRRRNMERAVREIVAAGRRAELVVAIQFFIHLPAQMERIVVDSLRRLGTDYADFLIFGYFNRFPGENLLVKARELKQKGLCRFLGLSSHYRPLFAQRETIKTFDLFHIRYSAAHPGAEKDIFPYLPAEESRRPGIVAFNVTKGGQLLLGKGKTRKRYWPGELLPSFLERLTRKAGLAGGELTASECYRFALGNPYIDLVAAGPASEREVREDVGLLSAGPLPLEEASRLQRWAERRR
jgi:aryl-alcohol dehydrogenase-like predicted oxidoreductase